MVVGLLPNSHFHILTNAPSWTTSTVAGGGAAGVSGTGMGITGAAAAGRMLGTNGASPCGFLSRVPMFVSSTVGWSAN